MGMQFLFMDDNAPCHRTVAAEQLLESEDIERMDWPARSPDLNPIKHVWDFLGRRLAARTLPPVTIRELQLTLQDEWAAMPQQLIDTLILSTGRRCETCLAKDKINSSVKIFRLTAVTYGTKSAPYLAPRSVKQLAIDDGDKYPLAADVIMPDVYMDTLLTGADDLESGRKLQVQLISIIKGCWNGIPQVVS
ncbi:transposable element Tcb2 transposase [Trichonephila clavipes]|uniref:Transposable element Tcb2 transposase n=1 Tax=Trichonephila clavipes TaxID=2585209 RepID=A0A8X6S3R7_TRICX|nr:transposable element Tcb2 transposase [Trichonephila clavipes]